MFPTGGFDGPRRGSEGRQIRLGSARRRCGGDLVLFFPVFGIRRRHLGTGTPDRLHKGRALLAQNALHTADGVTFAVKQMAHAAQQIDIFGTIKAPTATAFHRPNLREPAFPETQHVLRHVDFVGDLADGAECPRRFVHWPVPRKDSRSLPPRYGVTSAAASELIRCLRIAEGLNTITRRGEIGTSLPVFGFRPIR